MLKNKKGNEHTMAIIAIVAIVAVVGLIMISSNQKTGVTGQLISEVGCNRILDAQAMFDCTGAGAGTPRCDGIATALSKCCLPAGECAVHTSKECCSGQIDPLGRACPRANAGQCI